MQKKFFGLAVFSGNQVIDPDGAADALRKAGFEVVHLPPDSDSDAYVEGDTALEAAIVGAGLYDVWYRINTIAKHFGGECPECGETSHWSSYVH